MFQISENKELFSLSFCNRVVKCLYHFFFKITAFFIVFFQGFELLLSALGDPSERVVSATHQVFLPAYAAWTTELGNLQFHLIPTLLNKIEKLLRVCTQLFLHWKIFFVFFTCTLEEREKKNPRKKSNLPQTKHTLL